MSYQVLARKWRPHTFDEMVGQEPILRMLINALNNQRLHHAYLFTGTRGVGKTTLGRLLSKCLNCETGITANPCNTCSTCLAIDSGRFLDLLEIDAASRTKVEDTRELLDNVQYAPTMGRYKIYLIDEVHMLSGHSFNALLKTLEEPPAHVKFILATTDPKRLPITILSRCLQFNLKRVPETQIANHLKHICTAEKVDFEFPALQQLAVGADGSLRDSLSLLDQAIAFCGETITDTLVRDMLGNVEQAAIFRLLILLADKNGVGLLQEIQTLSESAPDFQGVCESILSILQQVAIRQVLNTANDEQPEIEQLAHVFSAEDVQLYYQIALIGRRDLAITPSPKQGFEMIMLRMLAFKPGIEETAVAPQALPTTKIPTPAPITAPAAPKPATPSIIASTPTKAAPIATTAIPADAWSELLPYLKLTGMALALASNCALTEMTDTTISLALSHKHEPMLNAKLIDRLEAALLAHTGKPIKLQIQVSSGDLNTTAKQQAETKKNQLASAVDAIHNDDHVQKIINVFGATLDVESIKAIDQP